MFHLHFGKKAEKNPAYERMMRLRTLLFNVPGATNEFGAALCQEIRSDDQQKLIDYLEANPDVNADDILDFVTREIFQHQAEIEKG
ncbi:MAG: hypothetical protein LKG42_05525 [Eubacterium sp.]|jgi:hypothetical protein|nr:hypothetical protein [Eubacterium sp.]MCH4046294.1 hypothetical protein [Eubacterium sp.]MCH4079389.1 hypothetical protein [Eubacterium sp.]MCI1307460.1 hypothetical protein [Eubacterium sp.]MCI1405978.1 hypothetical protein [Eubacterium sp.]